MGHIGRNGCLQCTYMGKTKFYSHLVDVEVGFSFTMNGHGVI